MKIDMELLKRCQAEAKDSSRKDYMSGRLRYMPFAVGTSGPAGWCIELTGECVMVCKTRELAEEVMALMLYAYAIKDGAPTSSEEFSFEFAPDGGHSNF